MASYDVEHSSNVRQPLPHLAHGSSHVFFLFRFLSVCLFLSPSLSSRAPFHPVVTTATAVVVRYFSGRGGDRCAAPHARSVALLAPSARPLLTPSAYSFPSSAPARLGTPGIAPGAGTQRRRRARGGRGDHHRGAFVDVAELRACAFELSPRYDGAHASIVVCHVSTATSTFKTSFCSGTSSGKDTCRRRSG